MRILAVIPARAGSKRIPDKNVRSFAGRSLIAWTTGFAHASGLFTRIVVSTDGDTIAAAALGEGAKIEIRQRPIELGSDTASTLDVVRDVIDRQRDAGEAYDMIALLQPTTPIRRVEDWLRAIEALQSHANDAAVGVSRARDHPAHAFACDEAGYLQPWSNPDLLSARSQDLAPAWVVNGSLYLIRQEALDVHGSFFPPLTVPIPIDDPLLRIDLDTEADWRAAEALVLQEKVS